MAVTIYKDINQFSPTKKSYGFVTNEQSVYQSLYNLLTTRPGERLFFPEYGTALEDELFELNDARTQSRILIIVQNAIKQFEPRVDLDRAASGVSVDVDNYQIKLSLVFSIKGITDRQFAIEETLNRL